MKIKNLVGFKFGRWEIISFAQRKNKRSWWNCKCACGTEKEVNQHILVSGQSKSCGCLGRENLIKAVTKHGMSRSPEMRTWEGMIKRCYKKNNTAYSHYGGRGIVVCDEWKNSFEQFYADMKNKPFPKAHIDRIDNNREYSKENCRWVTCKENERNRRDNVFLTHMGMTKCLSEWAEYLGINRLTLVGRNRKKLPIEQILSVERLPHVNQYTKNR